MALAIFDLDNTLLAGDSDHLWGTFLVEQELVDGDHYERENDRFYREYDEGALDIFEFLRFSLKPLSENNPDLLHELRERFLMEKIDPIILDAGRDLVEKHKRQGDTALIITATNSFVTAPIARRLGIEHLIATEPEIIDGRYTGNVAGEPSYQHGKVERLATWLQEHNQTLDGSSFYSDSHNDIPLLEQVDNPVAVDPDDILASHATTHGWPIISLRDS
ncbi:MAG: HAD family hydrolase [Gammaproteobacteria bacterium]|nr:HAD family hydrolase [Gammaproteobacteria bacterium]